MEGRYAVWGTVYQVGGPQLSHADDCCVYAVDCGEEVSLVDAGSGRGLKNIIEHLNLIFPDKQLTTVFATHGHIDHIGGLVYLRERLGLENIIAHKDDYQIIAHGDPEATASRMCGLYYRGAKPTKVLQGEGDIRVGDTVFHILHTPGHTPGSISIYLETEEKRILFGQDLHGPFDGSWGSDLKDWRHSMLRLKQLKADILCEGRVGVIRGSKQVQEYIETFLEKYQG